MKKRIIALLLGLITVFSFAACAKTGAAGGDTRRDYTSTVERTDPDEHYVGGEKTLHRKTITETDRVFTSDGKTDYAILVGASGEEIGKAATFLSGQIGACTGAYPSIVFDTDQDLVVDGSEEEIVWNNEAKYLVLSHEALERQAGVQWASDADLSYSGYMIKSVGGSVFMKVNSVYGYQTVSQSFCREVLGYEWYAEDTIVFTKSGSTLPDMDIVEKPDFDFIYRSGYVSTGGKFASGQTDNETFVMTQGETVATDSKFVHNSYDYLPPEKYCDESNPAQYHPKWYSDKAGIDANRDPLNIVPHQLCYSCHGDAEEYELMLQTAAESMMKFLQKQPSPCTITFTQQDVWTACDCETCTAATEAFGAVASTYIMFLNDLDDIVQKKLQEEADETGTPKRELTILFFAYRATKDAPVSGNSKEDYAVAKNPDNKIVLDGKTYTLPYKKTYPDGIRCNENVGCFWAPIEAQYNKSFYDESSGTNETFRTNLEKWGLVTDKLYAWIYDTNFVDFLFPFNSYDSLFETVRCLKENNATFIFGQAQGIYGSYGNYVTTCFGSFKTYCNLTVPFDVNQNYGTLTDKWFANYFRDAAAPMREFYEKMATYLRLLEEKYPQIFTGSQKDAFISQPQYWPVALMEDWLALCDKAYAAVAKYEASDAELYAVLVRHIKIETIFPRFVICENYGGYYTNAQIGQFRQEFYDDCQELGIQLYSEHVPISTWFEKWGVI